MRIENCALSIFYLQRVEIELSSFSCQINLKPISVNIRETVHACWGGSVLKAIRIEHNTRIIQSEIKRNEHKSGDKIF